MPGVLAARADAVEEPLAAEEGAAVQCGPVRLQILVGDLRPCRDGALGQAGHGVARAYHSLGVAPTERE